VKEADNDYRNKRYLADVLITIGDQLAADSKFLPNAVRFFQSAVYIAHPSGNVRQKAIGRIITHAPNLPDKWSQIDAFLFAARPTYVRPNSKEETQAVEGFIQSVESLPDINDRLRKYEEASYYDSSYHYTPYKPLPGDCLLMRNIAERLEQIDKTMSELFPPRVAAGQFVEKYEQKNLG
jgi:hypothetical protein